ncbi:hypothetical protein CYLTODRAFT_422097 [Cylindrobasidium torrendii FP15055 ss-10]|uniref:Uncharacterized protein n=1 Tax=Cylindrobasidium torrendii FP15055 ss-10 TaxID=1314674 RepID=A0A0D7BCB6_9AGAR|nr:hypothetical protein CYLTODRAFT_422097 [Cylindrobasidium torrendii FP15055 ss-10]
MDEATEAVVEGIRRTNDERRITGKEPEQPRIMFEILMEKGLMSREQVDKAIEEEGSNITFEHIEPTPGEPPKPVTGRSKDPIESLNTHTRAYQRCRRKVPASSRNPEETQSQHRQRRRRHLGFGHVQRFERCSRTLEETLPT